MDKDSMSCGIIPTRWSQDIVVRWKPGFSRFQACVNSDISLYMLIGIDLVKTNWYDWSFAVFTESHRVVTKHARFELLLVSVFAFTCPKRYILTRNIKRMVIELNSMTEIIIVYLSSHYLVIHHLVSPCKLRQVVLRCIIKASKHHSLPRPASQTWEAI